MKSFITYYDFHKSLWLVKKPRKMNHWKIQSLRWVPSILGHTLFLMTFLMMLSMILLSMLIILLFVIKCYQASDLWQQLELASGLESDLWDTIKWSKKRLVDFNVGKAQLISSDRPNNTGLLMWKWMSLFLRKNDIWRGWGWTSLLHWIGALPLSLLLKLPPRKLDL